MEAIHHMIFWLMLACNLPLVLAYNICRIQCKRHSLKVWRGCRGSLPHCTLYQHPGAGEVMNLDFTTLGAPIDLGNFPKVDHISIHHPQDIPLCGLIVNNTKIVTVNNFICVSITIRSRKS